MPGSCSIDKRHLLADLVASQRVKHTYTHRNAADAVADDDGSISDDQPDPDSDPPT